jgi:hypothetical protein
MSSGFTIAASHGSHQHRHLEFKGREIKTEMAERVGFESTSDKETKECCGAAWPSKELKRKGGNP